MAIVLIAIGLFLYLRFADELDQTIDQGLGARANDLAVRLQEDGRPEQPGELAEEGLSFVQIPDARGRLLDGAPPLDVPVLTREELARTRDAPITLERGSLPSADGDESRLLARSVEARGEDFTVVSGVSLEERNASLESLKTLLLIGGPLSLLFASIAGYGVASAALRPVESMRVRAGGVSETDLAQRLPVPPASDEISRLGETLNAMLSRLESAFARERAFISDASHELRTPLAILRAELELALGGDSRSRSSGRRSTRRSRRLID